MRGRTPWPGSLCLGPGWALYVGPAGDTGFHAHHAIQVALGQDEAVELILSGDRVIQGNAILVPPDVPHCLRTGGKWAGLIFVEPESTLGHRMLATCTIMEAHILEESQAQSLRVGVWAMNSGKPTSLGFSHLIENSFPGSRGLLRPLDPRVTRVLRELKAMGGVGTLTAMARALDLSSSRLGHLFSSQVGLPFRPYVLWLRLQEALGQISQGRNLTEAAHGAGFSDSAHLTRTFRRMFGIAPSDLVRSASILPGGEEPQP